MREKNWFGGLSGFIVGATMMVPGVSGASMAMILGVYDRLIGAVSSFRKNPKDSAVFLLSFSVCALVGIFLCSAPLSWLMLNHPVPTLYFFGGAVFGGIPMICKKAGGKLWSADSLIYIMVGILAVLLIGMIPIDMEASWEQDGLKYQAMLVLLGAPAASALILPGISVSHFLLVLGLYEKLIEAIKRLEFDFLIPLGVGIVIGVILMTKILEYIMVHFPKMTYFVILGFVLGSALEIFPEITEGKMILWAVLMCLLGFLSVYWITREE